MRRPEAISSPVLSLVVLALSLVFEGASLRIGYREYKRIVRGRKVDGEAVSLWRFIALSKDPNLYESLLENSAAMIGIVLAAMGVLTSVYLDWLWADGVSSIAIGVLLVADSLVIALATRSLIAGESVSPLTRQEIDAAMRKLDSDVTVERLDTLQLGPRTALAALTIAPMPERMVVDVQRDFDENGRALRKADERIVHVLFRFGESPS